MKGEMSPPRHTFLIGKGLLQGSEISSDDIYMCFTFPSEQLIEMIVIYK